LSFAHGLAVALPLGYEALQVTTATDGFTFLGNPIINDTGEILYTRAFFASSQLMSTRRGAVSGDLGSNFFFADMNNFGQIVYAYDDSRGIRVYSRQSGEIGIGNQPKINDLGFVAARNIGPSADSGPLGQYQLGIFSPDRTVDQVVLDPNALYVGQVVHLTNAGELLYTAPTATNDFAQLFSTTRGQLTDFPLGFESVMANDRGEFSYVFDGSLYWQDGTRISDGIHNCTDMNNLGDIVCNRQREFLANPYDLPEPMRYGTFDSILLTTRAADYRSRDGFAFTVPEPSSLALLSVALALWAMLMAWLKWQMPAFHIFTSEYSAIYSNSALYRLASPGPTSSRPSRAL
jgi:hypothetical protein